MRCRVVCALRDTMESLAPIRALDKVDFPTFGRPTMATKPQRKGVLICVPGIGPRAGSTERVACAGAARSAGLLWCQAADVPAWRQPAQLHDGWSRPLAPGYPAARLLRPLQTIDYAPRHAKRQRYRRAAEGAGPANAPVTAF